MNFNVHRADILGLVGLKFCISMRLPGEAEAPSLGVWGHTLVAGPQAICRCFCIMVFSLDTQ